MLPLIWGYWEYSLLNEDRTPPGESSSAERDAGERQGGENKSHIPTQPGQILLKKIKDK